MTLTTAEAAAYLGIRPATVRRWVMKGWLVPVRGSTRPLRFRFSDVEAARAARMSAAQVARFEEMTRRWDAACLTGHAT